MDHHIQLLQRLLDQHLRTDDIKELLQHLEWSNPETLLDAVAGLLSKVSAIFGVSGQGVDSLDLKALLQHMVGMTVRVLAAQRGTLFLNDPSTDELFSYISDGDAQVSIRLPNDVGLAGAVFQSGEALIVDDAYRDKRFQPHFDQITGFRTRQVLCVPIRTSDQRILGVIQLLNKNDGESFLAPDQALLEMIMLQASASLQNARLFEEVQRAREDETQLLEVTTAISTELQLQPLLLKIMDTTTAILNADRSTLFMFDEKTDELWALLAQGTNNHEIRFPAHLGIAGSVFTENKTINIPDAYRDDRFNPQVDRKTGYKTNSILCMPVSTKEGKVIGVLQVLNKQGGPFTSIDEKRLKAFSAQASIALENAKLFDEMLNMKNYNESIVESLSDGVISLDQEHHIVKCNQAARVLLGLGEQVLEEVLVDDLLGAQNPWLIEAIDQVADSGQIHSALDTELKLPHDGVASVNLTVTPLISTKQEQIGAIVILEDITQEKRLRGAMSRYMTKELADKLLEEGETVLGGKAQEVSVLFSDIRRFTTIAEQLGAQETVSMLNDYFGLMVDIIFRHQGILDKYIGDAIMAVFGVPFRNGEDADNAVRVGIEMLRAMRPFNRERRLRGQMPLDIGIGVNTAEVISGNIGSLKRMDYTVVGDGVNLAARLEGANKFYSTELLISEFTYKQLIGDYVLREIDRLQVKGKHQPVAIYEVMDHYDPDSSLDLCALREAYSEGLQRYRAQDWDAAIRLFQDTVRAFPQDGPSQIYLERAQYFSEHPPATDWDGVWVLKEK